jgi:hypothetical protein
LRTVTLARHSRLAVVFPKLQHPLGLLHPTVYLQTMPLKNQSKDRALDGFSRRSKQDTIHSVTVNLVFLVDTVSKPRNQTLVSFMRLTGGRNPPLAWMVLCSPTLDNKSENSENEWLPSTDTTFSKSFRKCGSYFRKHFESNKEKVSRETISRMRSDILIQN